MLKADYGVKNMLILKALKNYFSCQERKKKPWGMTWKFEHLKNKGSAFLYFSFLAHSIHSNLLLVHLDTDSTVSCIQG